MFGFFSEELKHPLNDLANHYHRFPDAPSSALIVLRREIPGCDGGTMSAVLPNPHGSARPRPAAQTSVHHSTSLRAFSLQKGQSPLWKLGNLTMW
ncbi:hypothetical protein DPEC_G00302770 [Dallia pectoralis]|uniref:Uncharacterized protein n=1 Tax=Dallia pectoralis TaxID=75939 RepID=A0ACC2FH49_DALPE|nr:hypothetical protein DPEC_G00302770 [Dallia pectoralis]